jgi:hypothetical protein
MTAQDEDHETAQASAYNPFPEPQTIPSGWDTSGFFSTPEPFDLAQDNPVSAKEADDSAES